VYGWGGAAYPTGDPTAEPELSSVAKLHFADSVKGNSVDWPLGAFVWTMARGGDASDDDEGFSLSFVKDVAMLSWAAICCVVCYRFCCKRRPVYTGL